MPYIKAEDRNKFPLLATIIPESEGELNYCITKLITNYIKQKCVVPEEKAKEILAKTVASIIRPDCVSVVKAPNYALYNAVIGVLECAKMELYRRQISPYEDRKIAENGDVY